MLLFNWTLEIKLIFCEGFIIVISILSKLKETYNVADSNRKVVIQYHCVAISPEW
jgi:hypothetical protein